MTNKDIILKTLTEFGFGPAQDPHSWRCYHPDRYGDCACAAELAEWLEKALANHTLWDEAYHIGFADGEGSLEGSPNAPAYWRAEEDGYNRARQNIVLGIDPMPTVVIPYDEAIANAPGPFNDEEKTDGF